MENIAMVKKYWHIIDMVLRPQINATQMQQTFKLPLPGNTYCRGVSL